MLLIAFIFITLSNGIVFSSPQGFRDDNVKVRRLPNLTFYNPKPDNPQLLHHQPSHDTRLRSFWPVNNQTARRLPTGVQSNQVMPYNYQYQPFGRSPQGYQTMNNLAGPTPGPMMRSTTVVNLMYPGGSQFQNYPAQGQQPMYQNGPQSTGAPYPGSTPPIGGSTLQPGPSRKKVKVLICKLQKAK